MMKRLTVMLATALTMGIGLLALAEGEAVASQPAVADAMLQKIKTITFPTLDLDDISIRDAVAQLITLSKEFDPEQKGVAITVDAQIPSTTYVELEDLENITLYEALKMMCAGNKLAFTEKDGGIVIAPIVSQ